MVGNFVSETGIVRGVSRGFGRGVRIGERGDSHEKTLMRARDAISELVDRVGVRPREDVIAQAHRIYKIALETNFTRGRKADQVAAVCVYIVCRQDSKPFMLIDFSDQLSVNVFALGAVFLALVQRLRLETHPTISRPIDPSLYIHRFADRLRLGKLMHPVANTALRLVSMMKRDWIQTGRHPAGVCGAALFLASRMHGHSVSKHDVLAVVHVGTDTLAKRLDEIASTTMAGFTPEEFYEQAELAEAETAALLDAPPEDTPALLPGGCEHLAQGSAHYAANMCKACYKSYLSLSGGHTLEGRDPVAFIAAKSAPKLLEGTGDDDALSDYLQELTLMLSLPMPDRKTTARVLQREEMRRLTDGSTLGRTPEADAAVDDELDRLARAGDGAGAPSEETLALLPAEAAELYREQQAALQRALDERRAQRRTAVHRSVLLWQQQALALAQQEGSGDEEAGDGGAGAGGPEGEARPGPGSGGPPDGAAPPPAEKDGAGAGDERDDSSTSGMGDVPMEAVLPMLHTEAESQLKGKLWEELNREWLEEQARKSKQEPLAIEAPERDPSGKRIRGRPKGSKSRPRPNEETLGADATAEDAARQALEYNRVSSKVNYDALSELFGSIGPDGGGGGDAGAGSGAGPSGTGGGAGEGRPGRRADVEGPAEAAPAPKRVRFDGGGGGHEAAGAEAGEEGGMRLPEEESGRFRAGLGLDVVRNKAVRPQGSRFRPGGAVRR